MLFQGRNYDKITGLYFFRARYFHPQLGRFLQTDPMGYEDSMNMYQGFNQNPVNFIDPMGMISGSDPGYSVMNRAGVSDEKINKLRYYETRFHTLFAEGATNAAIKSFLIPANYLLFPIKIAAGLDFDVSVNFSKKGSFIRGGIKKKDRINIAKDQSLIYPMADFVTQTGQDFYFGFMHQRGQSSIGKSSRENIVRSAGATGFNIALWGGVAKSTWKETANYVETSSTSNVAGKPKWKLYEERYGGKQTQMETIYKGQKVRVRLDRPPTATTIIDFKDYSWLKQTYQKSFIQEMVKKSFKGQIEKYRTIRKKIIFQFSSKPPKWIIDTIKKEGGKYIVKN